MRDQASGWIQVSSIEFFLLWTSLGLGEPPVPLEVAHVGRTRESRAAMAHAASQALADRDLGTVAAPARDLALMLRQLAGDGLTLDLRVLGQGSPLVGYATAGDRGGAVAARVDGEIRLGSVRSTAVAGSLLASLPPMPAGDGRPANIPVADYESACAEARREGVNGFVRVLHEAGVRQQEVSVLAHALTTRRGGGQLGASYRGTRAPGLLTWLDAEDGRYALRRHGPWLTVTPADLPRLTSMAEDVVADLR
ncbi:ESX secretion-associated protein EspG [Actinophytocola sediminis]